MTRPTPKQQAPELNLPLLNGSQWNLHEQDPEHFTLIAFYRGLHCPICKKYLNKLQELQDDFNEKGVDVIAVSMDEEVRARKSRKDWDIGDLTVGYGLKEETARDWGLYISEAIKEEEPEIFSEPGLFLVDSSRAVYYSALNSNPWGRPHLPNMAKAIDFILEENYPARGEKTP